MLQSFNNQPPKKKFSYVVRAVSKPPSNRKKIIKIATVASVILVNFGFLVGFIGYYSRTSGSILNNANNTFNNVSEQLQLSNLKLPNVDRGSLNFFSTEFQDLPRVTTITDATDKDISQILQNKTAIKPDNPNQLPKLPSSDWKLIGKGDFNNDSQSDLVFYKRSENKAMVWLVQNGKLVGIKKLPSVDGSKWSLVGVDDFDGNGNGDLIWRYTELKDPKEEKLLLWNMEASKIKSQQWLNTGIDKLGEWEFAGTGEFDGNQVPDLIFRYQGLVSEYQGANLVVYMQRKKAIQPLDKNATEWLPWQKETGVNNQLSQDLQVITDFNQDGYPDIVWQKNRFFKDETRRGELTVWLMKDRDKVGEIQFTQKISPVWTPLFFDYDGDFNQDIVWYNTGARSESSSCEGAFAVWLLFKPYRSEVKIKDQLSGC